MCAMRAMRAMTALLVMCCGVLLPLCGAQTHVPTFTIESPADFSTLVIKPPESKLNNLVIQFSSEDIPDDSEICVIISAFGTSQNKPEQCISSNSNHIALSGLEPGHYVFQFIVKSESAPEKYLFNTLEVLRVAVLTIADILPALEFATSHDLFFIKQDDASSVDVALDLSIAGFELFDMLDLCVEVAEIKDGGTAVPISDVCTSLLGTPSTGTYLSFSLPQLPIGSYQATLMLQNSRTIPLQRFPSSKRLKNFRVVSRADTLPLLVPPTENVEFVVEHMRETVEVKIPHLLFAKDASILQADAVQVCVRLYTPPHRERISEDNYVSDVRGNIVSNKNDMFRDCISVNSESSMSVGHLKPGIHHYELALKDGDEIIPSSMVTGITDIRRPQEFIPDFEWKKLHAWHTAPKGLEIRLPIGGSGLKEARVPEPWRMQLSMPHPCKFFLRLDTFKDTSVKFIRDAATKKCKVDDHCLYLETIGEQENTILNDNDTVLTSQMYQKKVELQFNSSCVDVNDGDEDEEDLDIRY